MRKLTLGAIAGIAVLIAGLPGASAQSTSASDAERVLARIGERPLTTDDVRQLLESRPRTFASIPAEQRWATALQTLIAERVLDARYNRREGELSASVREAIASGQRQIMLDLFVRARFEPDPPSPEAVDAYIAEHPYLFANRFAYRFQVLGVRTDTPSSRDAAERVLAPLQGASPPSPEAVADQVEVMAREGLRPQLNYEWASSETLSASLRARLERMRRDGRAVDLETGENQLVLTILYAADPAPVDPSLVRERVRERLIDEQFERHREAIISELSAPVLELIREREEAEPSSADGGVADAGATRAAQGADLREPIGLTLSAVTVASLVLGVSGLTSWLRLVFRKAPLLKNLGLRSMGGRHPARATLVCIVVLTPALLSVWNGARFALLHQPLIASAVVVAASAALGLLAWWLVWRNSTKPQQRLDRSAGSGYDSAELSVGDQRVLMQRSQPLLWAGAIGALLSFLASTALAITLATL
ncbi:hypothetical protein V6X63_10105 [Spiribacter sp. 221]|uniref:hypothetical protein n=1 Tax=Spiribacter onubensis TaxID=3122420 RepID=UPI00349F6B6E